MSLTIDGNANSITSSTAGVNIPATVDTLSVGPSGSYMIANSSGVGIGTLTPQDKLTVLGKVQIQQDSGSNNRIVLRGQPGSSYRWNIDNYSSSNNFRIFREDDVTAANGISYMTIDSAGRMTTPYQPAFMVRGDESGSKASDSKFSFTKTPGDAKICFDRANNWSDANDRFTAPVAGVYQFTFGLYRQSATSSIFSVAPRVNGSQVSNGDTFIFFTSATGETGNTDDGMYGTFYMNLSANDYVELYMRSGATTITIYGGHSFFGGHLIG